MLPTNSLTASGQPLQIRGGEEKDKEGGSLVTSRKNLGNPSGNTRQDSGAFLLTTELFERANQIVACPITGAAH